MATCEVRDLRCEYFVDPLGLTEPRPRLSWRLADERRGAGQTAYEVACAASPEALDSAALWSSGKVATSATAHVEYAGPALRSGQRVWWRVRVWDHEGQPTPWSDAAWWEMGLLQREEWKGQWIGSSLVGGPRTSSPCPYLRKVFRCDKPVQRARLHITALGMYEASLNGVRIGDDVLTPGWTDYSKRVQCQTYDVTGQLQQGDNAIGVILGDGWYCGFVSWMGRQLWGDRPKLLAQLDVTYSDGSVTRIVTDDSWRTGFGPLLESDMLMGESYDARLEIPEWDTTGFDDRAWTSAVTFDVPAIEIHSSASPRVRKVQELAPTTPILPGRKRHWQFDLGQNIAGSVRLRMRGAKGLTVTLRYAEMLNANGTLYTANLRAARATDHYTFRGDGEETWEPRFTFHGFQHVELACRHGDFEVLECAAVVLMSQTPFTGSFECSDPLINQLYSNIQWGQRGNFLEVPTDCPQRDERLGWTGDAQIFVPTACFNADVAGFFTKWTKDLEDAQSPAGAYPSVAPNRGISTIDGGPAWAEAGIICPWTIYQHYGDTRILDRHYASMERFLGYLDATSHDGIRPHPGPGVYAGYGDWLAIDAPRPGEAPTPKPLVGTAYHAHAADLLARIADVLAKPDDAARFRQTRDRVRAAFCREYVAPSGRIVGNSQTGYLLALAFDLLPDALRPVAVDHLVARIADADWHLTTGFVGTPLLCETLTRFGRHDVAWRVFRQETYPGWLYSVLQGATTMWERWNSYTKDKGFGDAGMNSFNHYAYGSIGRWMAASLAGLEVIDHRTVRIAPQPPSPDAQGRSLDHAQASHTTMHGPVTTAWQRNGDRITLDVTIPPNVTATLQLPTPVTDHDAPDLTWHDDRRTATLPAGRYRFTCPALR